MMVKLLFASSVHGWAGSEYLWSQCAARLAAAHQVVAALPIESVRHPAAHGLKNSGVNVRAIPKAPSLVERVKRRLLPSNMTDHLDDDFESIVAEESPDLIILSSGGLFAADANMVRTLSKSNIPYVNIANAAHVDWAVEDELAAHLRIYAENAAAMYFVSRENISHCETQLSIRLKNAEIVKNPYLVKHEPGLDWPVENELDCLRLACVGRLFYPAKGQDLLLEALSDSAWRNRAWRLSFFGTGPHAETVRRLSIMHGISDRVEFHGHVSDIEAIWRTHHVLVLPSRYEGLPIAIIEAMLCGRPVLAGDVGGARDLIVDGENGFLSPPGSIVALRDVLERLWNARGSLRSFGRRAQVAATNYVSADPVGDFISTLSRATQIAL